MGKTEEKTEEVIVAVRKQYANLDMQNSARIQNSPDINPVPIVINGGFTILPEHINAVFIIESDATITLITPTPGFRFSIVQTGGIAHVQSGTGHQIQGYNLGGRVFISGENIVSESLGGAWTKFFCYDANNWAFEGGVEWVIE